MDDHTLQAYGIHRACLPGYEIDGFHTFPPSTLLVAMGHLLLDPLTSTLEFTWKSSWDYRGTMIWTTTTETLTDIDEPFV